MKTFSKLLFVNYIEYVLYEHVCLDEILVKCRNRGGCAYMFVWSLYDFLIETLSDGISIL